GFIDSPPERQIDLGNHPSLHATLRLPLCGERRAAYCYVRPDRTEAFGPYVRGQPAGGGRPYRSEMVIEQGWFGPGPPDPRLKERVGDYTLVMRDNWTVKDWLPDEQRYRHIGVHAGLSVEEMIVPLVVAQP